VGSCAPGRRAALPYILNFLFYLVTFSAIAKLNAIPCTKFLQCTSFSMG